ncbi:MAG: hypothetical protein PHU43_07850 [Candidatus Bipolaricaulis sp.]|nr:hypothetical protein [Candidatus Bipolaricaulis sp.]
MRKALVLGLLILGLGLAASAQLAGYWSTTVGVDPSATELTGFLVKLDSKLSVDYTLSTWVFSAVSAFDLAGFASQTFKVAGSLGAFNLESNLAFDPAFITEKTYTDVNAAFPSPTQTSSAVCPLVWEATDSDPAFLTWDVTASVSIAGVGIEVYVLQDYSYAQVDLVNYVYHDTGTALVPELVSLCPGDDNGMGWRLKVTGSFGDVDITSYTYFNLYELTMNEYLSAYTYEPSTCPSVAKSGSFDIYPDCELGSFVEEYVTLEGFSIGCATIDLGVSIQCGGFAYATAVVSDISIGGWASLDFGITFTTISKAFATCITFVTPAFDCFILELGFGAYAYGTITNNFIDSIYVHGIKFSTTWGGVTFTSITEFDKASMLMSNSYDWSYLNGPDQIGVLLPYFGIENMATCADSVPDYYGEADDLWYVSCLALERFQQWEKFVIDVDADACCGGLFDLTVATFFGNWQELTGYAYVVVPAGALTGTPVNLIGTTALTAFTLPTTTKTYDRLYTLSTWTNGPTTLFDWAQTQVDLAVGIGSNVKLTFGFDISGFGWESLEFGFKWSF